jgi:hypothetical protein
MAAMSDGIPSNRLESRPIRAMTLAALLLVSTLLLGNAIGDLPFHTKGEPREALVVQSMVEQQRYTLVLRNGDEIPSKPPLFHWLATLATYASGELTETTVRLPSMISGLALILLTTLLGFRYWGTLAGLAGGTALLSTQQFIASATTARVDMVLAGCVAIAVALGAMALQDRRPVPLTFYLACSLAVLTKGPVGYVLPIAIVAIYAVAAGHRPRFSDLRVGWALPILGLPIVWYVAAWSIGGQDFLDKLLLKENVYRVLDPNAVQAGHVKPFWFYGPALLGAGAPWSLCLPAIAADAWRKRRALDTEGMLLPLVWIVTTVGLFSLAASKRSVYLLPCFPAVALLIGHWISSSGSKEPLPRMLRIACLAIAAIVGTAIGLIALQAIGIPAIGWIEHVVGNESDRANLAALVEIAGSMRSPLLIWATAALGLLGLATHSLLGRRRIAGFAAGASLIMLSVAVAGTPMQREMAKRQSLEPFIARVAKIIPATDPVYFYGLPDYSAAYYLERPIPPTENAKMLSGRNRTWYFVWEQSVDELCNLRRGRSQNPGRLRCREHDRYDFFGNPKRDELVLVAMTTRRRDSPNRPSSSQ